MIYNGTGWQVEDRLKYVFEHRHRGEAIMGQRVPNGKKTTAETEAESLCSLLGSRS